MPLESGTYVSKLVDNAAGQKLIADFLAPKFDVLVCDAQTLATTSGTANEIEFTPYGNITSGSVQLALQDLEDLKATKVTSSPIAEDNFTSLTATGDIQDSGYNANSFIPVLTESPIPEGNFAAISATGTIEDSGYSATSFTGNIAHLHIMYAGIGSDVEVGTGTDFVVIPATYNGWNVTRLDVTVYTTSAGGATDCNVIRRRAGLNASILATDASVIANNYKAFSVDVDTANDDVATGDLLFVTVTGVPTPRMQGLALVIVMEKP